MKHANNHLSNELLKIGSMLGLEKKDIMRLKNKKDSDKDTKNVVSLQDPADAYNSSVSYYGTVSIKDFQ
ncbi:MAG: hypothetical protein JSW60_09815 [Thermoplasmatales archaeon]|nr:MAG: hypothetical protein JSW60_09815 [Thermoplasmatales archaeon]